MSSFDALLLNLEGTITPISFIKHTLYIYAKSNVENFIRTNFGNDEVQDAIEKLRYCATVERRRDKNVTIVPDAEDNNEDIVVKTTKNVLYWMSNNSQLPAVQYFLRRMWKFAYKNEKLKAKVYDDLQNLLKKVAPIPAFIYGSYVVAHQKMFFSFTTSGSLTQWISGYFDETIGLKSDSSSYTTIATEIGLKPDRILFVTSNESDARAARSAGFLVLLLARDGNPPFDSNTDFTILTSLNDIVNHSTKRKVSFT